jgi:deoxyribose-phosphate aldolase
VITCADLAKVIDHTLLKPEATTGDVLKLCDEAAAFNFTAICINPIHVRAASERLAGTGIKVGAVIGFPLGANTTATKAAEAAGAVMAGAEELDMVMSIGLIKEGREEEVIKDITAVRQAAHALRTGVILKVILETSLLTREELILACRLSVAGGADYVKTSTGFGPRGASVEDVLLMSQAVGPGIGVKASGGIRSLDFVIDLLGAGATRIGTSSGAAIMEQAASLPGKEV